MRDDGHFNLILEDLGAGFRPGDQIAGCSIAEAHAVAVELAGLNWPRRRAAGASRSAGFYRQGALVMHARFADTLTPADLVEPWTATVSATQSLIHSDPRVDNILFGTTPAGVAAWLIDLQQMAVGDPAYDLAYFLNSSLAPAERLPANARSSKPMPGWCGPLGMPIPTRSPGNAIACNRWQSWRQPCRQRAAFLTGPTSIG